jgi:hypothetical protein
MWRGFYMNLHDLIIELYLAVSCCRIMRWHTSGEGASVKIWTVPFRLFWGNYISFMGCGVWKNILHYSTKVRVLQLLCSRWNRVSLLPIPKPCTWIIVTATLEAASFICGLYLILILLFSFRTLFTSKLGLNLRKKLVKCHIWSIVFCMVPKCGLFGN